MEPTPPDLDSLRLQLEGRWTHLEQARVRELRLLRQLGSWRWRQRLRERPESLHEAREQEAGLHEVVTYVEDRARRERWPRDHPGQELLSGLHARRAKLVARLHQRLAGPTPMKAVSFTELLEHLWARVLESEPPALSSGEQVLLDGWSASGARPGRYWLTEGRLLWRPWGGGRPEALATPREALGTEGICPAYLHAADYPNERRWGVALFRAQQVVFIPVHRITVREYLLRLVSKKERPPEPAWPRWQEALSEHLRHLPPARLGALLDTLVRLRAAECWPSAGVRPLADTRWTFQLEKSQEFLGIDPPSRDPELRSFLDRAFHQVPPLHEPRLLRDGWRRRLPEKACILLGLLLETLPLFMGSSDKGPALYGAGYLLLVWGSMRYAKIRNITPWLVLPGSVFCVMGGMFSVLLLNDNTEPLHRR